ncbi:sodium:calcium antiporter [bacterium]|nr:sodium:calcium antiporter [candidate division CSSED10-310 bacterium]
MITINVIYILTALVLLWKGADLLVDSSSRIAYGLGISQLIIGLTVVAFGTSVPEFAVSIGAALRGQSDISVSNVIGSNIFNLGFIMGGVAIIRTIKSSAKLVWRDGMVMMAATIAIAWFLMDLRLSRLESLILFAGIIAYNVHLFTLKEPREDVDLSERVMQPSDFGILLLSIVSVLLGGYLLRCGSVTIATAFGISQWVIGATIVAAGTSAPEFVTSLVASLKGNHGISAGNLIGSCTFNILGVLGIAGLLRPMQVDPQARFSLFLLVLLVLVSIMLLRHRWRLSRADGILLVILSLITWVTGYAG